MDEEEKVYPKDEWRSLYTTTDLLACVHAMAAVKAEKEGLEEQLGEVNAHYDVLRMEVVPQKMEEGGHEMLKIKGIGRVTLTGDLFVSTKKGAGGGLIAWFRKNKLGDIIKDTINSSTLKAFVKGRMKDGKPYPEEFLNITPVTRASITKGD